MAAASLSLLCGATTAMAADPDVHAGLFAATLAPSTAAPSALAQTALAQSAFSGPTVPLAPAAGLVDISMRPVADGSARLQTATFVRSLPAPAPLAPDATPSAAPDLFGSVALLVGHTPEDSKWMRARAYQPSTAAGPWAVVIQRARQMGSLERLAAVNTYVNRRIAYATPDAQYGVADYWATAAESLTSGRGNCTAYAIAKLELLRAAGVPTDDLYLVLVRDLVRRADHAIVAVRVDGRFVILDSGTDAVLSQSDVGDYRPILTYGFGRTWIHGFRETPQIQQAPQVMVAQATTPALAPAAGALQ